MTKYPVLPARKIIGVLKRLGFEIVGQRGSHIKLRKQCKGRNSTTIVPNHKTVMPGTLKGILELGGIEIAEFLANL